MDDRERGQHQRDTEALFSAVQALRELPDGYAIRFPAETRMIQQAGAFISRERLCCPFIGFTLEVEPDHGPVWLTLTGREGVKAFLKENFVPQLDLDPNGS